jgi:Tol biopolymer transport system component
MKLRWAVAFAAAAVLGALPAGAGSAPTPAPTPIDGKIAYTSTWDGQSDIYSLDAKNVLNLTHDKTIDVRADVQPVWSPAGDYVAFERQYTKGGADLMVVRADGTQQLHSLLPGASRGTWNCHPSWSRGNVVFFTSNRDGNFDLYAVSATGTKVLKLTNTDAPVQNLGPAVSPDGRTVAFYRTGLPWGVAQLYLLDVASGKTVQLTANLHNGGDMDPTWSPDGTRVAFTSDRMGSQDVWLVNADGTGLMQATYDVGTETHPAFSPDGRQLAYVSDVTGATELFTTRTPPMPFVTPPTRITFDGAYKANPSWQTSTSLAVR